MKLVVGLGNPGEKYEKTRHNVGFMVVDELNCPTSEVGQFGEVVFLKPETFMNESGQAVSKTKNFYKIDLNDVYVIHDDLDIKLGEYKIQKGVGPKIHNGVSSVEKQLGSKDFWRVRIGIDNRDGRPIPGEKYVLEKFTKKERKRIDEVMKKAVEELSGMIE